MSEPARLPKVEIYTDGACRGNPGVGGWGAILRYRTKDQCREQTLKGHEAYTTNNQMELTAAIEALSGLKRPCQVALTTDSTYVKNGITQWIGQWKLNNWRTKQKKPVKNKELWQRLDKLASQHDISWFWVKGHADHPENEWADSLANEAIDDYLSSS